MGDIVHAKAPDVDIHPEECLGVFGSDPFTIVIMGATGDLTARKLVPALFNLYLNKGLPKFFQIVGCGRTKLDDQQFRKKMEHALEPAHRQNRSEWLMFQDAIHYFPVDYEDLDSYIHLAEVLKHLDQKHHTQGNRIFYLALPPSLYQTVAQTIGQAKLAKERDNHNGWSRIFQNRSLSGKRNRSKHLDVSICQFHLRTDLESKIY